MWSGAAFSGLLLCLFTGVQSYCSEDAVISADGNKCFVVVRLAEKYQRAVHICDLYGGRLAVIHNEVDRKNLADFARTELTTHDHLWIVNNLTENVCKTEKCLQIKKRKGTRKMCTQLGLNTGELKIASCKKEMPYACEVAENENAEHIREERSVGCPRGWQQFKKNCYKLFADEKTWADAEKHCSSQNAHLASIHEYREMEFLVTDFKPPNLLPRAWLGGKRNPAASGVTFQWSDGTPWDYDDGWNYGDVKGEGCVSTATSMEVLHEKWETFDCSTRASYFCKQPVH
uniref:C-type lectin domain-containing protein n=1 Tax=Steinernema glaseri TaxID=37863 RepID=A0A1I8A7J5_9BILA